MKLPKPCQFIMSIVICLLAASAGQADPWEAPASYYSGVSGIGANLKNSLTTAMSTGHIQRSYGTYRYMAAYTDADPNQSGNILLVYNRASVSGAWDSGVTWNREHVWPQSRQPGSASNSSLGNLGDPHALRPANPSINSSRSNKPFGLGDISGSYGSNNLYYWYPGDADQGDIARSLFYSDTRWTSLGISLVNGIPGTNQMGDLASLIKWHYRDVPDEFERRRNHVVYSATYNPYYTNNRNAYIDHPEYVWSVYVDQQNDSRIYVGPTNPGNGTSVLSFTERAIVGSAVSLSENVTIHKDGNDGTYFEVSTTGDATSSIEGRMNAFEIITSGSDSRNVTVGLSGINTSIAGRTEGTVVIDNLDVTTFGGTGRGANDGNDVILLQVDMVDHAQASFQSSTDQDVLVLDLGNVFAGATNPTANFSIHNLESTADYTADLDLDAIVGSGDTGNLFTNVVSGVSIAAGNSLNYQATMDTSIIGDFSAGWFIDNSDEDIAGAIAGTDLTIVLTGLVTYVGDFEFDLDLDATDIDLMFDEVLGSASDSLYDLTGDTSIDSDDTDYLVQTIFNTEYGDANLDGKVNIGDLTLLAGSFSSSGTWASGDFNGDGIINIGDLTILASHFDFDNGSSALPVPEPMSVLLIGIAGLSVLMRRKTVCQ